MDVLTLLGPLPAGGEDAFAALLIRSPDARPELAIDNEPEAAARACLRKARGEVRLDERHAAFGSALGLETAPLDEAQARTVALLTLGLANAGYLDKVTDPDLLDALGTSLAAFERAAPWRFLDSDYGCRAIVSGALGREREVIVLGSAGQEFGLVIDARVGKAELLRRSSPEEQHAIADAMDGILLYLEEEPAWTRGVLAAGLGLERFPMIRKLERGRSTPLRSDDARVLVASLRAVVAAVEARGPATGVCVHRGRRVEVQIDPSEALAAAGPATSLLHELDAVVAAKLLAFARTLPGFSEGWYHAGDLADARGLAIPFSLHARPFDGRTIAARAIAAGALEPGEAEWARAVAAAPLTLLEVQAASASGRIAVADMLTGARMVVHDVGAAESVHEREVLLARPVIFDDEIVLVGTLERPLLPMEAWAVRDAFLDAEGAERLDAEALADPDRALRLLALAVRPPAEEPAHDAGLYNTDGESVVAVEQIFEAPSGADVPAAIARIPGMTEERDGRFAWTRLGNALHPSWRRTVLGAVEVEGDRITAKTQSSQRADALRDQLAGAFGRPLRQLARAEEPARLPAGVTNVRRLEVDASTAPPGPALRLQGEAEELLVLREALGDGTDPARVLATHRKLCVREQQLARGGDPYERFDPERPPLDLRRLLGITWEGAFVGPDRLFAAMGAGVPLSTVLMAIAMPVADELDLSPAALFDFAGAIWNESRGQEGGDAALAAALGDRTGDPAVRDCARWMFEQARRLYGADRRRVHACSVAAHGDGFQLRVDSILPTGELDLPAAPARLAALAEYDPDEQPAAGDWSIVPPIWRRHLVAEAIRAEGRTFGRDFDAVVDRWVELEDAVAAGKPRKLVQAIRTIERRTGSRGVALNTVAGVLALRPDLPIGARMSRPLGALLDQVMEEIERAAG